MSDRLLRLPFYNDLARDDQEPVIETIREFDGWSARGVPSGERRRGGGR